MWEHSLIDFLHYVEESDDEHVPEIADRRLKKLNEIIQKIKLSREVEVPYILETTSKKVWDSVL